jgi:hypothetical protein
MTKGLPKQSFYLCRIIDVLVVTAAAKNNHYRKNDDPCAVVVKDVA